MAGEQGGECLNTSIQSAEHVSRSRGAPREITAVPANENDASATATKSTAKAPPMYGDCCVRRCIRCPRFCAEADSCGCADLRV